MIIGPKEWMKTRRSGWQIVHTRRLMQWHMFRCPLEWIAGPIAIRARPFDAAEKPWNQRRKPCVFKRSQDG